jgi:two-component system response regulator MprA
MRKKILVIDDDAAVRESLACALSYENFLVLPAANGEEALKVAAATPVDLVLLDLNMPGKGGWDTFERLTGERPLLPVIIITARPNQLFTALGAGAGALMEKPLDFPELLRTIRRLVAEPIDVRLARLAGRPAEFEYRPARGQHLVGKKE